MTEIKQISEAKTQEERKELFDFLVSKVGVEKAEKLLDFAEQLSQGPVDPKIIEMRRQHLRAVLGGQVAAEKEKR